MKRLLLGLLLLLSLATAVLADVPTTATENDPRTNTDANACYIGGSLYGKCENYDLNHDSKIDVEEVKYMHTAGWYVIRFEKGLIQRSQVPRMYRWLLGPEPVRPAVYPPYACFVTATPNYYPFQYSGTPNVPGNIISYEFGGCVTPYADAVGEPYMLIVAPTFAEARALCDATYGAGAKLDNSSFYGYPVPADWWECYDWSS